MIKYRVIENFDDFLRLEQPWNELVSQTDVDHAYMKHQWFECWIRNLGRTDNLVIITVWMDGQLIGIAPMQLTADKLKGLPVRALRFLSSGITPRCNFIVHESLDKKIFFDHVRATKGWDLMLTENVESKLDITRAYIDYLDSCNNKYKIEQGFISPFLTTRSSWDDYWKSLSQSFRKELNNAKNRLNKSESYKVFKITDYGQFSRYFDRLIETSAKSWKGRLGTDLKSDTKLQSFYIEFSRKGSEMGLFELWVLEIDNEVASFAYRLKSGNMLTGIRTDFDPKYKYYNPGKILQLFVVEDLFARNGLWEYDLGGFPGGHKTNWTNCVRNHYTIMAANSTFYGKLLMLGKLKVLPVIERIRPNRNSAAKADSA